MIDELVDPRTEADIVGPDVSPSEAEAVAPEGKRIIKWLDREWIIPAVFGWKAMKAYSKMVQYNDLAALVELVLGQGDPKQLDVLDELDPPADKVGELVEMLGEVMGASQGN